MNYGADFGYSGSFHLSKSYIDEIINAVRNGSTVEEAVVDWVSELDDCDYFIKMPF